MPGSREAQRRHRWRERRLLQRLRVELPDVWAAWWADTDREWDEQEKGQGWADGHD